jgi:phosphoesterase RecJ-like protein
MWAVTMIDPQLLTLLNTAQRVLCISHVKPDGDAIGSLLGMGWLLTALGKTPVLALQDETPVEHRALPGAEDIITAAAPAYAGTVRSSAFDLVVCLDASSPDRMGTAYNLDVHGSAPLLVIDHHITNTRFGAHNWVAPECAATCQMLVYLADALQVPLQGALAECLLTGMVTDTLCFRTSNTGAEVLEAAMRLMQGGANLTTITQRTVNRRPFSLIRLWGLILPTVRLAEGVIWATADQACFAEAGHGLDDDIGLSGHLVTADEADISAVLTETRDAAGALAVECSFRAKPGFDVAELAFSFGGGGHPAASGCTIAGTLAEVEALVVPAAQAARRRQAAAGVQAADG